MESILILFLLHLSCKCDHETENTFELVRVIVFLSINLKHRNNQVQNTLAQVEKLDLCQNYAGCKTGVIP